MAVGEEAPRPEQKGIRSTQLSELVAFTAEHVCRLTKLSPGQLRYWDKTHFFSPGLLEDGRRTFGRFYTFRDVVGLRAIAILRNECRVPLQELRRCGAWLYSKYDTPWSSLRFTVLGRKVLFFEPESGEPMHPKGQGQREFRIDLEPIANRMKREAEHLLKRQSDQVGKVTSSRFVAHNSPVMKGTRIPTEAIWGFHQAGYTAAAIVKEFPRLRVRDVSVAVRYERKRRAAA